MSYFYNEVLQPTLNSITEFKDRNAFCINDIFYTYKQFGEYISKIRIAIRDNENNNSIIGLVVNDDIETYASIFSLWMEGKSYVPLHPQWPLERCQDITLQIRMDLILDSSEKTMFDNKVILTHFLEYNHDCFDYSDEISDEELAYILFTSGSTGKPKGVIITRENVAAFMNSFWKTEISINHEDRCLQCFDLTFDVSVQGYLVPLTKGACCFTIPHGQVKYIYASSLIEDHKLTFGAMAPSMLRYLKPYFEELNATSLRHCILTAEACPLSLMEEWYKCAVNTEIYDFYGPTEATIYCTYYKLTKKGENKTLNGVISIGKPLADITVIVIDEKGDEVACGEKGELCVAGGQVTVGYWDNEDMNQKAFFLKEFNGQPMRFYHTGDLVYQDSEGDIMYSGRIDHQAKIQGFRVELGEIEFHAREFLKDKNVVCIAFDNEQHLTEIAIFIEDNEFDTDKLFKYMRTKIPSYMIPTRTLFINVFPLNSNDKIDKNKLKTLI